MTYRFPGAHFFIAIAQVEADEADQLIRLARRHGVSQIWNRHDSLLWLVLCTARERPVNEPSSAVTLVKKAGQHQSHVRLDCEVTVTAKA